MAIDLSEFRGKTALVTGASSGIGESLARQLAAIGANLILVARRQDRLDALTAELRRQHAIVADRIALDLSRPGSAQALHDQVASWGKPVDLLISNAGSGVYGWYLDQALDRHQAMVQLNAVTPSELVWLFGNAMRQQGYGRILLVASLAGHQASPAYASYGATKAFLLMLGEAVDLELRGSGVSVTVLSPGMTRTEFHAVADHKPGFLMSLMFTDADKVARAGLAGLLRRKPVVVPGLGNKALEQIKRLGPRSWQKWIAWAILRSQDLG